MFLTVLYTRYNFYNILLCAKRFEQMMHCKAMNLLLNSLGESSQKTMADAARNRRLWDLTRAWLRWA